MPTDPSPAGARPSADTNADEDRLAVVRPMACVPCRPGVKPGPRDLSRAVPAMRSGRPASDLSQCRESPSATPASFRH